MTQSAYRIRFLGTIDIVLPEGAPAPPSAYQPMKLGLLLMLCLTRSYVTRGWLAGMLWPDVDEKRARRSLSQLLHALRTDLGPDVLDTRGEEEIAVAWKSVSCDAVELREAYAARAWTVVVAADQGELAPAFSLGKSASFEEWLESQRRQLADIAADAAWHAGVAAEEAGALADAERFFLTCFMRRQLDENVLRRVMRLQERDGRGGAALALYESFRGMMARDLDSSPSIETRRLAAAIASTLSESGTGDAAVKSPAVVEGVPESMSGTLTAAAYVETPARRLSRARRWGVGAAAVVFVAIASFVGSQWAKDVRADTEPMGLSIGMPLIDGQTISPAHAELVRNLPRLIAARLSSPPALRVVSREQASGGNVLKLDGTVYGVGRDVRGDFVLIDGNGTIVRSFAVEWDSASTWDDAAARIDTRVRKEMGAYARAQLNASGTIRRIASRVAAAEARADDEAFDRVASELDHAAGLLAEVDASEFSDPQLMYFKFRVPELLAWNAVWSGKPERLDGILAAGIEDVRRVREHAKEADYAHAMARLWHMRVTFEMSPPVQWTDSASHYINRSAVLSPQNAYVWVMRSRIAAVRGDYTTTLSDANQALQLDPYLHVRNEILVRRFSAAFNLRKDSLATQNCEAIQTEMQMHGPAMMCALLMEAWGDAGATSRALPDVGRLDEHDASLAKILPPIRMQLAAALARRGKNVEAAAIVDSTLVPTDRTDIAYFRAAAMHQLGRTTAACAEISAMRNSVYGRRMLTAYPRIADAMCEARRSPQSGGVPGGR